ncbi:MAG: peroxiredoxin family protein [Candidatus Brocadiia bacterium]
MKTLKILLLVALLLPLAMANRFASSEDKKEEKPKVGSQVGEVAPAFTLEDIEGNNVALSDFKDKKAVMLVFWYIGCPSCRAEVPELVKMEKDFAAKGLKILALNVYDARDKLKKFAKDKEINYTILLDTKQDVSGSYKVVGVPNNILVDMKGIVRYNDFSLPGEKTIKSYLPPEEKKDEKPGDKK